MYYIFFALSICFVSVCNGRPSNTSPVNRLLRRDADPEDLSFIKTWTSVGDSYSAGIGAGSKNGGVGDYFCSRYDSSFPAIINSDYRLGDAGGRTFNYWPCSGAKTDDVIKQVNALSDGTQDLITISSGGNDALLTDILNECVYQWNSQATPLTSYCNDKLDEAQKVIDSDDFHGKLDNLINASKKKLKDGGHIYYVGYAGFWGQDSDQCNDITWAFWYVFGKREYLSKDKRTRMNTLVDNMNKALGDAASRGGDSVTFVDYNKYYAESLGRFCEDMYTETTPNRAGLLFYEWNTDDNADETTGSTAAVAADQAPGPWNVSPDLVMNGTFEGTINEMVRQALKDNPDWQSSLQAASGPPPDINSVQATDDQKVIGYSSNLLPDGYGRVFHPRPFGHQFIANLILYHMTADNAAKLNQDVPPEELDEGTCPANVGSTSGPDENATQPECDTSALGNIPYNVFSGSSVGSTDVYGKFCDAVDGDQTKALDWTVNASGDEKTPSRLRRLGKRTPPPNPSAYDSFSFELKWEPASGTDCQKSCNDAYAMISNSPCGHQGGEQNGMTAAGSLDVGCGKYSYKITGDDVPPPEGPPKAVLKAQYCFPSDVFGDHGDIQEYFQAEYVGFACAGTANMSIKKGDQPINFHTTTNDVPYNYTISWDQDCEVDVDEVNVYLPLGDGNQDANCLDLMQNNYKKCFNGGIGGSITAGCVTYEFKASLD